MDNSSLSSRQLETRSRLDAVRERLRGMALQAGAGARLPPVATLRRDMGISPNTLDKALSALEEEGVIERRHGVGIFVAASAPSRVRRLALICEPSYFRTANHSPFWNLLLEGIAHRAASERELLDCHFARPSGEEPRLPDIVRSDIESGRVDGAIGVVLHQETNRWLEDRVPFVSFGSYAKHYVSNDTKVSMGLGVKALADAGCERIGLWQPVPPFRREFYPAESVFRRALREHLEQRGLKFEAQLVKENRHLLQAPEDVTTETVQEQGFRTAMEVFGSGSSAQERPDGIIIGDDLMTRGALSAWSKLGIVPGRDVQVATHANRGSDVLRDSEAGLFLLEVDPRHVVALLFERLDALLNGQDLPLGPIHTNLHLRIGADVVH